MPGSCLSPRASRPSAPGQRVLGGPYFVGGGPKGYFGEVLRSSNVAGLGGHVSLTPKGGALGARFEVTYLQYGSETATVPIGAGEEAARSVSNTIFRVSAGPVLMRRHGSVRPYAYATVGATRFRTGTRVTADCDASCDDDQWVRVISTQTNSSDWTFSWSAGAGVLVPVGHHGAADVGINYLANGTVTWLAEGEVVDVGGRLQSDPHHSPANLFEFTVGWTFWH